VDLDLAGLELDALNELLAQGRRTARSIFGTAGPQPRDPQARGLAELRGDQVLNPRLDPARLIAERMAGGQRGELVEFGRGQLVGDAGQEAPTPKAVGGQGRVR